MNLVFDLGNSRLKWALADPGLQPGGALPYGEGFVDRLEATFDAYARPKRVLAVSVAAAENTELLARWLKARWNLVLEQVSAQAAQLGVTNSYAEPTRLGADRWAALIGARARASGSVCVVDCGTAVTIDALDAEGVFRGGVILPGLALQREVLLRRTRGIRAADGTASSCLARDTADAVAAGTLHGLAGAIDRILDKQAAALGAEPQVLITGGDAPAVQPCMQHASTHVPDLVLEGVARIAAQGGGE